MFIKKGFGYHHAITGPMFAGKTRELHRQYSVFKDVGFKVQVFKRDIDKRYSVDGIKTHDGIVFDKNDVFIASSVEDIRRQLKPDTDVIMIDEAQFYEEELVDMIAELVAKGKIVVTTVLPTDYRGKTFGIAGDLLARADFITSLHARCMHVNEDGSYCHEPATRTLRKVKVKDQILIGGKEYYEPRCRKHWLEDFKKIEGGADESS